MHKFNEYKLSKWSKMIRIRDEFRCVMCRRLPGRRRLQAHHIYSKSVYPDRAYLLSNGVSLCFSCHICVVHAETTFDLGNYKFFIPSFRRHVSLAEIKRFNQTYQERL